MGSERFTIDGGLYGYKGELKEQLRAGRPPNWLYPNGPRTSADDRLDKSASAADFFEAVVEAAKGKNENYAYHNRDHAYAEFRIFTSKRTRLSGPSGTLQMRRPTLAPERIRERVSEWLDENEERVYRQHAYAEFRRGPRVWVDLGRRGGIQDVELQMVYGN